MAILTIKNIPDFLYQELKNQAALHHRSISCEAIICLEHVLQTNKSKKDDVLKNARKLRVKTNKLKLTEKLLKIAKEDGRL